MPRLWAHAHRYLNGQCWLAIGLQVLLATAPMHTYGGTSPQGTTVGLVDRWLAVMCEQEFYGVYRVVGLYCECEPVEIY